MLKAGERVGVLRLVSCSILWVAKAKKVGRGLVDQWSLRPSGYLPPSHACRVVTTSEPAQATHTLPKQQFLCSLGMDGEGRGTHSGHRGSQLKGFPVYYVSCELAGALCFSSPGFILVFLAACLGANAFTFLSLQRGQAIAPTLEGLSKEERDVYQVPDARCTEQML